VFNNVIITSGPTVEPIDPVRYLSNRSSGKTGFYLAMEATKRGIGQVVFITGPTCFLPSGVDLVQVQTAREMRTSVMDRFGQADVVIMAAAVSDYRSADYSPNKLKKTNERISLELVKNPDILSELGGRKRKDQILVGFAAETEDVFINARKKLLNKNLDLLVLNKISPDNPAFGSEENQVCILRSDGMKEFAKTGKAVVATLVWDEIFDLPGRLQIDQRNR
jgi:phosphopantothenoylcysteine decarboxylase / phosphopantothenate---cysteine ligase